MVVYGSARKEEFDLKNVDAIDHIMDLKNLESTVVILLKQTSAEEEAWLLSMGYTVLAVYGIRFSCRKFKTAVELHSFIDEINRVERAVKKEEYLCRFSSFTEEEAQYLESTYGISKNSLKGKTEKTMPNGYSGKLITYRGSEQGFRDVVGKLQKIAKKKRFLLIDGDLLQPSFDDIFGYRKISTMQKSYLTGRDNTGFNIAIDMFARKESVDEILNKTTRKYSKNGYVLLGNYNIYNYEHYDSSLVQNLLFALLGRFDVVLIKLSDFLYDELAMIATHRADMNIILLEKKTSVIRFYHQVYELLIAKQDISANHIAVYRRTVKQSDYLLKSLFRGSYKGLFQHRIMGCLKKVMV